MRTAIVTLASLGLVLSLAGAARADTSAPPTLPPLPAAGPASTATLRGGATIVIPEGCSVHESGDQVMVVCADLAEAPLAPPDPPNAATTPGVVGRLAPSRVLIDRGYGWTTLIGVGCGGGIGSLIVHGVKGNWVKGGIALGLHTALPVAGIALGYAAISAFGSGDRYNQFMVGLMGGMLVGMATATLIDVTLLSREKVWVDADSDDALDAKRDGRLVQAETKRGAKLPLLPTFAVTPQGASVGAFTRF